MKTLMAFLLMAAGMPVALAGETLYSGSFSKKSQKIQGSYTIKKVDNRVVIEFDAAFKTKKGPDLQLVLSPLPFDNTNGENALSDGAISIGLLKSHKGAQQFTLPANFDIGKMKSLLIHCVRYSKLWGGAQLH